MGNIKRYAITAFCCVSFFVKPAQAFWPVLDFGEIIPVFKNVTDGIQTVSQVKSQLDEMKNTLKAIGDKIGGLRSFFPGLENMLDNITDSYSEVSGGVTAGLGSVTNIQNQVNGAINSVNKAQSDLVNGLVDSVNENIGIKLKVSENLNIRREMAVAFLAPEEVEAVEETTVEDETSSVVENAEVKASFAEVKAENKKLAVQLNDILDMSLQSIHKISDHIQQSLAGFDKNLSETTELEASAKEELKEKLAHIQEESQNLTDRMSSVLEAAKENYNAEYQEKISDGINNYEKTVEMYLRGDINEDAVVKAGEDLKNNAASISTMPDKLVLDEINEHSEKIKEELAQLGEELRNLVEKKGETGQN